MHALAGDHSLAGEATVIQRHRTVIRLLSRVSRLGSPLFLSPTELAHKKRAVLVSSREVDCLSWLDAVHSRDSHYGAHGKVMYGKMGLHRFTALNSRF